MVYLTIFSDLQSFLIYLLIIMLLGTGVFLSLRLSWVQFRYVQRGLLVALGRFDDPNAIGEVTHFQALTTALSATVGIGNIAGVAIAIHWGGPGAIFWMWVTALLGMATKFTEVTLAQKYRLITQEGGILGGPMYYIENGLGKRWKPLAMFFAVSLTFAALITGNAVQANTTADIMQTSFGIPPVITGTITALIIGFVILGGIQRISKITQVLAPLMATLYLVGGLTVLYFQADKVLPAFQLIFTEAFHPTAGVAGTGAGVFLQTLLWGVRRGLFSNEAGQGSAPIAHSVAKSSHPVSEGTVALLEPFIDTILICTITALTIITTGVWNTTTPTVMDLSSGDLSYVYLDDAGSGLSTGEKIDLPMGYPNASRIQIQWHEVPVNQFFIDPSMKVPFDGTLDINAQVGIMGNTKYQILYGHAVENGAPLTMWAYQSVLGNIGGLIVTICVLLFGISTAISWSYYGDQSTRYIFGVNVTLGYKVFYTVCHFLGAILSLNTIWDLGDVAMSLATIPNVVALIFLSGITQKLLNHYEKNHP